MALFWNRLKVTRGNKNNVNKELNWIPLTEAEQLQTITENSMVKPQLIFKHSTSCGISRMVLRSFEKNYPLEKDQADLYYLDLLANRALSNQVAQDFDTVHQSPQLLAIVNGKVAMQASHGDIYELSFLSLVG